MHRGRHVRLPGAQSVFDPFQAPWLQATCMHGIFPELILLHVLPGLLESRDNCKSLSTYIHLAKYQHLHVVEAGLNVYLLDHIPLTAVVSKGKVDISMLQL